MPPCFPRILFFLIHDIVYFKAYDQRTPIDNEDTGFTTVFPIPQKCLDLNKKLKQNSGYE